MTTLIFLAIWVALAIAIGIRAKTRGRSKGALIFWSLAISPLLAAIFLFLLPVKPPPAPQKHLELESDESRRTRLKRQDLQAIFGSVAAVAAILGLFLFFWLSAANAQESRSFYDRNGSFSGSTITRGNSTSVYDKNGRFDGTVIRNNNGTSSVYDRNGHFTGSTTNTTQPK
jgi:hypothetical protein